MSSSQATGFSVGADINPFQVAMRQMVDAAKTGQSGVAKTLVDLKTSAANASSGINGEFQKIGSMLTSLNTYMMGFVAVLAGGGALKKFITDANEWNSTAGKMAAQLGISTEKASVLNTALNRLGLDSDVYLKASQEMTKKVTENGKAFEVLGVKVKDSLGNYRPAMDVMAEVNQKLIAIKNPMEQSIAAQQVYGEGWEEVRGVLKITAETMASAEIRARELGLIVGPEGVAMSKQYGAQMKDLNLIGKSIEIQFGNSLLPVFTRMGSFMAQEGSMAGQVFGRVIEGIGFAAASTWLALRDMGDGIGALAAQAAALLSGDLAGFKAIGAARDEEAARNEAAYERLKAKFGKPLVFAKLPDDPNISTGPRYSFPKDSKDKKDTGKEPKEASYMQTYEAALTERKVMFEKENTLREFSKQQELDYWREILNTYTVGSKDRTSIAGKMGKIELDILRQGAKDKSAITQLHAEDYKAETLAFIGELDARAVFERNQGAMSQLDYLARQQAFNAMRLQAELDFIAQKIEVAKLDPESNVVSLEQLELQKLEIKRKYAALTADIGRQQVLDATAQQRDMFSGIRSGFEGATASMIQGTMNLQQGMQAVWNSILQGFGQFISKKVTAWALGETAQTGATVAGNTLRTSSDWLAATKSVAANAWAAVKNIAIKAWEVAASVYAAVSAIPVVGPWLAPVMAVAATGVVLGYAANVASASGGFDIPSGLNPLTQLHEQEMVLPAKHANVIRSLADDGQGGGGGSGDVHIHNHITAMDGDSVRRVLMNNTGALADSMKQAARNFQFAGVRI